MFAIHFLTAVSQVRIYTLCFFKKSGGLYYFPVFFLVLTDG